MSQEPLAPAPDRRFLPRWVAPVLVVLGLLAGGVVIARTVGLAAAIQGAIDYLRTLGAPAFFAAMATLPAVGFPLLPFALAAGPAYSPELGVVGVMACSVLAVAINVAISYLLAARVVRKPVQALIGRLGYQLPVPSAESAWLVTLLVRVAPGPPFWLQSYALGVLRVKFSAYLVVSTLVPAGYLLSAILLGDAFLTGRSRQAMLAAGVLGMFAVGIALLRKRLAGVRSR